MSSASSRFSGFSADPQLAHIKLPPHSLEAEQSVIGGLMLAPESLDRVGDFLTEQDFYRRDHRLIYRAIRELSERAAAGNPAAMSAHLVSCLQDVLWPVPIFMNYGFIDSEDVHNNKVCDNIGIVNSSS